jgi:hypothetical protein
MMRLREWQSYKTVRVSQPKTFALKPIKTWNQVEDSETLELFLCKNWVTPTSTMSKLATNITIGTWRIHRLSLEIPRVASASALTQDTHKAGRGNAMLLQ